MNVLRAKPGVQFDVIAPAGFHILAALDLTVAALRVDLEISCGTEGHPPSDPHTLGEAYDISVDDLPTEKVLQLVGFLRARLGEWFYLQYEAPRAPDDVHLAAIVVVNRAATAPHVHVQRKRGTNFPPVVASAATA